MNYLCYPVRVMNITQNHRQGNHARHNGFTPADYPFDEAASGTGRDLFYCPCDEMRVVKIYGVGSGGVNTVWLESTAPVTMPWGKATVTIMVEHPEDEDLNKLKVGKCFLRGEKMFREGKDGAVGNHFHISVATGSIKGAGWTKNSGGAWVLQTTGKALKMDEAFFMEDVSIRHSGGYTLQGKPKETATKERDNTPDDYAAKAVRWAKDHGILKGDTHGDLKLHQPITRQDAAVMLYRARQ